MKTVVGLFDSFAEAQSVVQELESNGFPAGDISLVAQKDVLAESEGDGTATGTGAAIGAGLGLLAGLAAVTVPGIGIVAAVGPIIATGILGAVAGGLVGSLADAGVPADDAQAYAEGVRRGGTLVTVAARNEDAPRAIQIMDRHNPVNLNERSLTWGSSTIRNGSETISHDEAVSRAVATDCPDPTGQTTMGDEVAAAPAPPVAPMSAIPAPSVQPTRDVPPGQDRGTSNADLNRPEPGFGRDRTRESV
jgi:hypothetical protein